MSSIITFVFFFRRRKVAKNSLVLLPDAEKRAEEYNCVSQVSNCEKSSDVLGLQKFAKKVRAAP